MSRLTPVAAVLGCLLWIGCSPAKTAAARNGKVYGMGERAQVGPLIYTVLDTEWLDQIGEPPSSRLPRNRFLAVRMSITNSGASVSGVPAMTITSPDGQSIPELENAQGVPEWLGYVRSVKPAETLHGRVVFDAPSSAYQLRCANDADPENEVYALVDLPLQLGQPQIPIGAGK